MKILLVDDEPFFIDELNLIIEQFSKKHPLEQLEIFQAYSGEEALDLIPELMPECVFTDIKMTNITGVELAKKIKDKWPAIKIVIISGFPSFEYAKEAMKVNVIDFLTKPVYEEDVYAILSDLVKENSIQQHREIQQQFESIIRKQKSSLDKEFAEFINSRYNFFYTIYVKNNDFMNDFSFSSPIESLLIKRIYSLLDYKEDIWVVNDYYHGDSIIMIALKEKNKRKIDSILLEAFDCFSSDSFVSIAHGSVSVSIVTLLDSLPAIRQKLYASIKVGKSQIIDGSEPLNVDFLNHQLISGTVLEKLRLFIYNQNWQNFRKEICELFLNWQNEEITCAMIEKNLKKIVRLVEEHGEIIESNKFFFIEKRIEEIVYIADSFDELREAFWQMFTEDIFNGEKHIVKDTQLIFDDVKNFLERNLHEPITLTFLTDKFNISKTQLCRLFRNNMNQSFVEYLTYLRIKKAKVLISQSPELLLKDVAQMVGIIDHFYFSKIFKHHVGVSPSAFKESLIK
ncbi:response regulator [Metabacillus halosaccharovorans]|uniref:response regulator n=1 Tax=Metabacillus halosaccharovorans TaxID=930124 RepID=UPI001C1FABB1|nr:response regulator [Metabacillus halosaccharovorans]MBU7591278.1 response regulator [Metabacillus halosaccharovorans]